MSQLTSAWQLEIGHGGNIYAAKPTNFTNHLPHPTPFEAQLLNIHQHAKGRTLIKILKRMKSSFAVT